jgi:hypothetical protein
MILSLRNEIFILRSAVNSKYNKESNTNRVS